MKIKALVDSLISSHHFEDARKLRTARLFVRACLLTSLFSTTYIWLSIIFEYDIGVYFMSFNVVGFVILALLTKTRIPLIILQNTYVFIGAVAVLALTYFSGGVWSAIYPWIISIPVLALLVANRLSASVWGVISFGFMLWFGWLAISGVTLPTEYNTEMHTLWYVSVVPGLLLIILFISFVFESIQTNALNEVEEKNVLLKKQTSTITEQSAILEKLIDEKEYIIRILAHDLRSPLKNIGSLLGLMKLEKDSSQHEQYVIMAQKASESAQELVNKVLALESSSQEEVHIEEIDVSHLIKEVIDAMRDEALQKEIKINLSNKCSTHCKVKADPTYLSLIFENLISNAVKFSENGNPVKAEIKNQDNNILVRIIDNGPGINQEEQDRLFQKFSKLSNRPTGGETSTGLGLALVKRYVELINGKVWYENNENAGAVFVVELPLA